MTQQFRVIISGRRLSGAPLAEIKAEVGRVFKLQGEQLDQLLNGKPKVVARSSPREAAEKLRDRMHALDLEAHIEALAAAAPPPPPVAAEPQAAKPAEADELFALSGPGTVAAANNLPTGALPSPALALVAEAPEVVCPKCGEGQPKRTLCRKCGLDMPRYLAAQEAAEQQARAERAAELEAKRPPPGGGPRISGAAQASLFGLGFGGRLGRLDYFTGSLLSSLIWVLFALLAVSTGKASFIGFGLFLGVVFSLRCFALRLHDTGRTGWLALVALVPFLGGLMALVLLFMGGEEEDNEYGEPPAEGGGLRAILVIVALVVVSGLGLRSISENPEKAKRFLEVMQASQRSKGAAAANDSDEGSATAVRYASNNRIDIYVIAGCTDCDQMQSWLRINGLRYTVYAVDSDQGAAERLHSIIGGGGNIQLPVLEINGKVLPGNPGLGEVHRHLRQETP